MQKMLLSAVPVLTVASIAIAQAPEAATDAGRAAVPPRQPDSSYVIAVGAAHQFNTDIDESGISEDFNLTRYGASIGMAYPIRNTPLSVAHSLVYEYDDYSFSGNPFAIISIPEPISEPWDDTHLLSYSVRLNYELNRDWSIFGGPIVGFAAESGADLSDSILYGGTLGLTYNVNPNFTFGFGVIGAAGIEESFRLLPLIIVQYRVTDTLTIRNARPQPGLRGTAGVELDYEFAPAWSAGVGFAYDRRRFRLDEDGPLPDYIGENSSYPVYARLAYTPNQRLSVSAVAGVLFGGELRLETPSGRRFTRSDYDPAPFAGATLAYRF